MQIYSKQPLNSRKIPICEGYRQKRLSDVSKISTLFLIVSTHEFQDLLKFGGSPHVIPYYKCYNGETLRSDRTKQKLSKFITEIQIENKSTDVSVAKLTVLFSKKKIKNFSVKLLSLSYLLLLSSQVQLQDCLVRRQSKDIRKAVGLSGKEKDQLLKKSYVVFYLFCFILLFLLKARYDRYNSTLKPYFVKR